MTPGIEQTAIWDVVAERLEVFVAAWKAGGDPTIADHLPADPIPLRRLVLVELVKVDLEFRMRGGRPARIEDYLVDHAEIAEAAGPPIELICEEYHLRRSLGESVELDELRRRFPGRAAEIWRWLGAGERTMTTSFASDVGRATFQPGQIVDDFQVLAEVGSGTFATVYLARQVSMGRIVALKVSGDRGEEARTLAQLDHPHVVRVHDQRRLPPVAGRPAVRLIYEQFLPGGTLAQVVERVRRTPARDRTGAILVEAVREATAGSGLGLATGSPALASLARMPWSAVVVRVGIQLADALAHAHAAGVLHRDVKPANVLHRSDGWRARRGPGGAGTARSLAGARPGREPRGSRDAHQPGRLCEGAIDLAIPSKGVEPQRRRRAAAVAMPAARAGSLTQYLLAREPGWQGFGLGRRGLVTSRPRFRWDLCRGDSSGDQPGPSGDQP